MNVGVRWRIYLMTHNRFLSDGRRTSPDFEWLKNLAIDVDKFEDMQYMVSKLYHFADTK